MTEMSDPIHNASDDLLMSYATGALPQAYDLVVATHVSLSRDSRARLDGFEAIGGAVLDQIEGVAPAEDSLDHVLARIEVAGPLDDAAPVPADGVLPDPLRRIVGGDLDAIQWRPVGMGVKQAVLHDGEDGTARLLSIPAGGEMPRHSHRGLELTLVLQGAYRDEDDRFARGDLEIADEDVHHTPVAEASADCICLIATDARLKFDGLLPRIAQPFIGI